MAGKEKAKGDLITSNKRRKTPKSNSVRSKESFETEMNENSMKKRGCDCHKNISGEQRIGDHEGGRVIG